MKFQVSTRPSNDADAIFVCIPNTGDSLGSYRYLGSDLVNFITNSMSSFNFLKANTKKSLVVTYTDIQTSKIVPVVLFNMGKFQPVNKMNLNELAIEILKNVIDQKWENIELHFSLGLMSKSVEEDYLLHLISSMLAEKYNFNLKVKYNEKIFSDMLMTIIVKQEVEYELSTNQSKMFNIAKLADGIILSKYLCEMPSNLMTPQIFSNKITESLSPLNVDIKIYDEKQIKDLGMNAMTCVSDGSNNPPLLIVLSYNGAEETDERIALVGKGVTFDSGGISLKPASKMEEMKYDMSGASVIAGTIYSIAARKAKVNVCAVLGMVENMPSGSAVKPGDVVGSMSGLSIEVINTDAEGRLVLADALWYAQKVLGCNKVIDVATLTGAVVVALGDSFAGIMSNDEELASRLINSGEAVGERLWRLPLDQAYSDNLKSNIADIRNIGKVSGAGASSAGAFLQKFIESGTSWAHIDIAGVAKLRSSKLPDYIEASAFGVRLLNNFISEFE